MTDFFKLKCGDCIEADGLSLKTWSAKDSGVELINIHSYLGIGLSVITAKSDNVDLILCYRSLVIIGLEVYATVESSTKEEALDLHADFLEEWPKRCNINFVPYKYGR